eukprot:2671669-Prymnesium_polylepis.1
MQSSPPETNVFLPYAARRPLPFTLWALFAHCGLRRLAPLPSLRLSPSFCLPPAPAGAAPASGSALRPCFSALLCLPLSPASSPLRLCRSRPPLLVLFPPPPLPLLVRRRASAAGAAAAAAVAAAASALVAGGDLIP